MDEGTTKKISALQVGIEPMTSVMLAGCSNYQVMRTPGELLYSHLLGTVASFLLLYPWTR